eukprot:jgi/Galph1/2110/GphlegSOOS_G807.1
MASKLPSSRLSKCEKAILIWYLIDAVTHLTTELAFVYHSLTTTVNQATHWTSWLWKEYAKADARWGRFHDCTVAMEVVTSLLWGPVALICAYGVYMRKQWRHVWQLILCVGELYGGWMTFGPDWLTSFVSRKSELNPHKHWIHLWVYLIFANMVWVIIPVLLAFESYRVLVGACRVSRSHQDPSLLLGEREGKIIKWTLYTFIGVMLLFGILLPAGIIPAPV